MGFAVVWGEGTHADPRANIPLAEPHAVGKAAIMQRSTPNLAVMAMLFVIGVSTLLRFSQHVRLVDAVGLSGGGAACGAAMFGIIYGVRSRKA
jgi:hypothetical protein